MSKYEDFLSVIKHDGSDWLNFVLDLFGRGYLSPSDVEKTSDTVLSETQEN